MKIKTLSGYLTLTGIENLNFCLSNSISANRFFGGTNSSLWKIRLLNVCANTGYVLYSFLSFETPRKLRYAICKILQNGQTELLPKVYTEKQGILEFSNLTNQLTQ